MKYFIFLTNIFLMACGGIPKEYLQNDILCQYDTPIFIISKEEMVFDVDKYSGQLTQSGIILKEDSLFQNRIYKWKDSDNITNKQTNKQTNIEKTIKYNSKGKILFSYFQHEPGDVLLGKETFYDEQGNITKIIDHEKGYTICWAEAIELAKGYARNYIRRFPAVEFVVQRVSLHEYPGERPIWAIGIAPIPDDTPGEGFYYRIDGITGKFLGRYKLKVPHY